MPRRLRLNPLTNTLITLASAVRQLPWAREKWIERGREGRTEAGTDGRKDGGRQGGRTNGGKPERGKEGGREK